MCSVQGKNGIRQEYDAICHRLSHWLKASFLPHPPQQATNHSYFIGSVFALLFHPHKDNYCGSDSLHLVCLKRKRENVPLFPMRCCWCTDSAPDFNYQDAKALLPHLASASALCCWNAAGWEGFHHWGTMQCLTGKSSAHATGVQLSTLALRKKDHSRVAL